MPVEVYSQQRQQALTSYRFYILCFLTTGYEDDVALTCIGISIFEEEHLVNTIVLKCAEFHKTTNCASETLLKNEILLSRDLCDMLVYKQHGYFKRCQSYSHLQANARDPFSLFLL